jgi:hypothetical protein
MLTTEATEGRNSNSRKCSLTRRTAQPEQRLRIAGLQPCFADDVFVVVVVVAAAVVVVVAVVDVV